LRAVAVRYPFTAQLEQEEVTLRDDMMSVLNKEDILVGEKGRVLERLYRWYW